MSKYRNEQAASSDRKVFSSKRERNRYEELLLLHKMGKITKPRCQPSYELIPAQEGERAVHYFADFVYAEMVDGVPGPLHVEDTKGFKTRDYIIKRKLMLHRYGIRVEEI